MTRKEELQKELDAIKSKEMATKLKDLNSLEASVDSQVRLAETKSHRNIMYGDFAIKIAVAFGVTAAFMHVVYTGNAEAMSDPNTFQQAVSSNGNFQLLSVLGPLFGMVLQYYFGKNKAGANGE